MTVSNAILGVCLALASTPESEVFLPTTSFVLAWDHSIEKVRWEENYNIVQSSLGQPQLSAGVARIKGSAAGMEPPTDAILRNGWYEYQPNPYPNVPLQLTRSGFTADYQFCFDNFCQEMQTLLATDSGITLLYPCTNKQINK